MVLDAPHVSRGGEKLVEMAAPSGRIWAFAVAVYLGGVEHRLDPAAHPVRRLGSGLPNRGERLHDQAGVDRGDGEIAHDWIDIGGESVPPLLPVRFISPAGLLLLEQILGNLAEASPLRLGQTLRLPFSLLGFERVYTLKPLSAPL